MGYILNVVDTSTGNEKTMSTAKNDLILSASATGCAVLSCSFSVSRSVFQDAENQGGGTYLLCPDSGRNGNASVCIAQQGAVHSDGVRIRIPAGISSSFRVVEEKIGTFIAVVRRAAGQIGRRIRAFVCRSFTPYRQAFLRQVAVPPCVGRLRL